jgi:hypothetical protein
MKETYLAVAGRIRRELEELTQIVERIAHIWRQAGRASQDYYVDAVALNLHSFYVGIERVLEMIANRIDQTRPSGANWHQELLHQMTADIPSTRPAVLSSELRNRLDRYRGFRHVVRNVYTFQLDAQQIEALVRQLQPTMEQASRELLTFADFLERVGVGAPESNARNPMQC